MTVRCLIDTNVLIDYLDNDDTSALIGNVERSLRAGSLVSVITTMELLGWRGHTAQSRHDAENLLRSMGEIGLSRPVVDTVIRLRRTLAIKLPDAIIAASALVESLPLMTRNLDDFKGVPGLSLLDPIAAP